MTKFSYPFSQEDSEIAYKEWGANCGPNALAFALQIPLADVRGKIPDFEARRYTSPTMMKSGIANLGRKFEVMPLVATDGESNAMFPRDGISLVRVQWTGPWTAPDANPKWAYRQTHWIATYRLIGLLPSEYTVFDVNGGIRSFNSWCKEIAPALAASIKRADGKWFPTHVWRIL